jgi:hypothetical protein
MADMTTNTVGTAKRNIVLNNLRNSTEGKKAYADQLRTQYGLSSTSKLSDQEVIQSAYDVQQEKEPGLAPHDFTSDLHTAYGDKVDKSLLSQSQKNYPSATNEGALVDKLYHEHMKSEEAPPIDDLTKAQIVQRHWPKLADANVNTDKALKAQYKTAQASGQDTGSYEDWLHSMAAPTVWEKTKTVGGALAHGLIQQGKDVGTAGRLALSPTELQTKVALAMTGDKDAQEELKRAGKGAVTAASFAVAPGVGAGLKALEGVAGAAETMPLLSGAAEGMGVGATQAGGEASVEGKSLADIAKEATGGAAMGIIPGAIAGAIHGHVQKVSDAAELARATAADEAAKQAGSADLSDLAREPLPPPPPTDPIEIAARLRGEHGWIASKQNFAKKFGMDPAEVARLTEGDEPPITDLAAANSRHGVTIDDINELKQARPDHLATPEAVAPGAPPSPAASQVAPAPASGPVAPGSAPPPAGATLPEDLNTRLQTALQAGSEAAAEQKKLAHVERVNRIVEAQGAFKAAGGGVAGHAASLAKLEGELPKAKFEAVKGFFQPGEIDDMFNAIENSKSIQPYDRVAARNGLQTLLGMEGPGAPAPSQLALLGRVFGDDFVKATMKDRSMMAKVGAALRTAIQIPRTIMTSHGFSVFGRQAAGLIGKPEYWKAMIPVAKAWGNEQFAQGVMTDLESRPTFGIAKEAGVQFGDVHQGIARITEEANASAHVLERLPYGVGNFFRRNNRAFVAGLNKIRMDSFDRIYNNALRAKVDVSEESFRKALAEVVNQSTGRGPLPKKVGEASRLLGEALFSPRLMASRLNAFNPAYYLSKPPVLMQEAATQMASSVAAGVGLLGLLAMAGWKVGTDWRSADFGKAKLGNTRIDVWGGHSQVARFIGQMYSGETVSSTTGKVTSLTTGKFGAKGRLDVIANFFSNKEAPIPSFVVATINKMDNRLGPDGKPIDLGKEAWDRMLPIPMSATLKSIEEWQNNPSMVSGLAVASQVGVGVETYGQDVVSTHAPLSFKQDNVEMELAAGKPRDQFLTEIESADTHATARALAITTNGKVPMDDEQRDKLTKQLVKSERAKVIYRWKQANASAIQRGRQTHAKVLLNITPEEATQNALLKEKP